jgi:hypothetical protein
MEDEVTDPKTIMIEGVNPVPWKAADVSLGKKGGRLVARGTKPLILDQYQEQIQDEISENYPNLEPTSEESELWFWFWRSTANGQPADATNLQKSLEDALQGMIFVNDRQIKKVHTTIMEQKPSTIPFIIISWAPVTWDDDDDEKRRQIASLTSAPKADPRPPIDYTAGRLF